MSRCRPDGIFELAKSPEDYEGKVNSATHSKSSHAIYFGRGYDLVDLAFVENASELVNSPLSDKLSQRFDSTVYPKTVIHLFKFLQGETSLSSLPE
jgi:hypothetical protein